MNVELYTAVELPFFLDTQIVTTGYLILIDSCWILTLIFFFFFSLNIALFKLIMSPISLCHILEAIGLFLTERL